jgi:hypothetical protein
MVRNAVAAATAVSEAPTAVKRTRRRRGCDRVGAAMTIFVRTASAAASTDSAKPAWSGRWPYAGPGSSLRSSWSSFAKRASWRSHGSGWTETGEVDDRSGTSPARSSSKTARNRRRARWSRPRAVTVRHPTTAAICAGERPSHSASSRTSRSRGPSRRSASWTSASSRSGAAGCCGSDLLGGVQLALAGISVRERHAPAAPTGQFSQTETCFGLSPVNGSLFQPPQRSRNVIPASRAMRSSSDGHT